MVAKLGAALLAISTVATAQLMAPIPHSFRNNTANTKRQTQTFAPDHELDMDYAEMESYNAPHLDTFGATLRISTVDPAIQTEDFGDDVTDITCSNNNTMRITFANADAANQAKQQWTSPSMTIITLTSTCNDDEVRVPWNVSTPVFSGNVATLAGKPSTWHAVSHGITVDFGNKGNVTNPAVLATINNTFSKRDSNLASLDLSFDISGKTIYPPSIFGNTSLPVPMPSLPGGNLPVTQTCKKCTNKGKAQFSAGQIDIKAAIKSAAAQAEASASAVATHAIGAATSVGGQAVGSASVVATQAANVVTSAAVNAVNTASAIAVGGVSQIVGGAQSVATHAAGFLGGIIPRDNDPFQQVASNIDAGTLNLDLSGMSGHFEFETDVSVGKEFTVSMIPGGVTVSPLQIQGILSIGPKIDPTLVFKFDSDNPLSFNYGFEYTVPDGAGLELNLINPKSSKTNKLDQLKFTSLPFSTNAKEVAASGLNYSISFRPTISIGVTVLDNTIDPFELLFDVPKVNGNVAVAQNVNDKCEGEGKFDAFDVDASFTFDMGVGADINMAVIAASPSAMLVSKTGLFPMKACVPFHSRTGPATGGNTTSSAEDDSGDDEDKGSDNGEDGSDYQGDDTDVQTTSAARASSTAVKKASSTPTITASATAKAYGAALSKTSLSTKVASATLAKGAAATITPAPYRRHARSFA